MPRNENLYTAARMALLARGQTIEQFAARLKMHRNTFTLALRSPLCPHARRRICAALNLKDAA